MRRHQRTALPRLTMTTSGAGGRYCSTQNDSHSLVLPGTPRLSSVWLAPGAASRSARKTREAQSVCPRAEAPRPKVRLPPRATAVTACPARSLRSAAAPPPPSAGPPAATLPLSSTLSGSDRCVRKRSAAWDAPGDAQPSCLAVVQVVHSPLSNSTCSRSATTARSVRLQPRTTPSRTAGQASGRVPQERAAAGPAPAPLRGWCRGRRCHAMHAVLHHMFLTLRVQGGCSPRDSECQSHHSERESPLLFPTIKRGVSGRGCPPFVPMPLCRCQRANSA